MKRTFIINYFILILMITSACQGSKEGPSEDRNTWKTELEQKMPLLGHRNWIVVTDMAYPLQVKPGITTFFAKESYQDVLAYIKGLVQDSPHVTGVYYQDEELLLLNNTLCPGIVSFTDSIERILSPQKACYKPHEDLIQKLDSVSNLFEVVIVKTNLTMPYTSTFIELDCGYWNAKKQELLGK